MPVATMSAAVFTVGAYTFAGRQVSAGHSFESLDDAREAFQELCNRIDVASAAIFAWLEDGEIEELDFYAA